MAMKSGRKQRIGSILRSSLLQSWAWSKQYLIHFIQATTFCAIMPAYAKKNISTKKEKEAEKAWVFGQNEEVARRNKEP